MGDGYQANPPANSPSRVTDPEASRLDTTDGSRADDEHALLLGEVQQLPGVPLGDTLRDDGDGLDLRESKDVEGGGVHGTAGSEVDDDVGVRVLLDGLFDRGVNREQGLLGAPVELLDVVTTEWV